MAILPDTKLLEVQVALVIANVETVKVTLEAEAPCEVTLIVTTSTPLL
jgi:hypothetical protein